MKIAVAATFLLSIVTTASAQGFLDHLLSFGTMFPQVAVTGLDYSLDQEVEEVHFSFDAAFDNAPFPCECCPSGGRKLAEEEPNNRELGRMPVNCCIYGPTERFMDFTECCRADPTCELGGRRGLRGAEVEEESKAKDQQPRKLQGGEEGGEEGAAGGYGGSNTGTIKTGFAANEDVSDISLDVKIYYPGDSYYGGGYGRKLEGAEEKTEETE